MKRRESGITPPDTPGEARESSRPSRSGITLRDVVDARSRLQDAARDHALTVVMQRAVDEIGTLTASPVGFFHLVEADQQTISLQAWSSRTMERYCRIRERGLHCDVSQAGVWIDAVRRGRPTIHNDYAGLPHRRGLPDGHVGIVRQLVVPVRRGGLITAVLGIANKPDDYTETEAELVAVFADLIWDIIEKKRLEEELAAGRIWFRELFDNITSGVAVYEAVDDGADFIIRDINRAGLRAVGRKRLGEVAGKRLTTVFPGVAAMGLLDVFRRVHQRGIPEYHPGSRYTDRRVSLWVENYVCRIVTGEVVAIFNDITERREAELRLQEREALLRSILRAATAGIGVVVDRVFQQVNDRFCEMVGYPHDELLGQSARMVYPDDREFDRVGAMHRKLQTRRIGTVETRLRHRDGRIFDILLNAAPLDPDNIAAGVTFTATDITALKNSERELRRSEGTYRSMLESMKDPVYICSPDRRIEYLNPAMITRIGRDATGEPCHRALHDLDGPCPWCRDREKSAGSYFESEVISPRDKLHFHVSHSPIFKADGSISTLTIFRDTTEIKRLEHQLFQAQKMEIIGTLAGGIAHDFNNILGAILGYAELAAEELPETSPVRHKLDQILLAARRARDLVRQILTFSRIDAGAGRPLQPQPIIRECLRFIRASAPRTITITQDIATDGSVIMADPGRLHQLTMNLCTNAVQAMEEIGGTLRVSLENVFLDRGQLAEYPGIAPGNFIRLTVGDTGTGIDREHLHRIFDPYFTTKGTGQGTGLGLAVVQGIVRSSGGFVSVDSTPGKGSTFTVMLPAHRGKEREIAAEPAPPATGNEMVLLVDDEKPVAEVAEQILVRLGYRVTATTSSREALALFHRRPEDFDVVITDLTMPGMTGIQLAEEILATAPGMPIILCTGYNSRMDEAQARSAGFGTLLIKPVETRTYADTLRQVLEAGRGKDDPAGIPPEPGRQET
ncbi:MAG: PAS domain S-box protein [Deltaproteobacteria bacterium]|nr:PAS domain S-box protein [Candidatus Anaeroferrophillacea bacterium]